MFDFVSFEKKEFTFLGLMQLSIMIIICCFSLFANRFVPYLVSEDGNMQGMLGKLIEYAGIIGICIVGIILFLGLLFCFRRKFHFWGIVIQSASIMASLVYWLREWLRVDTPEKLPYYHINIWVLCFTLSCLWWLVFVRKKKYN